MTAPRRRPSRLENRKLTENICRCVQQIFQHRPATMPFLITSAITLSGLAFIVQNFDYSIIISVIKHKGEDFILLFSFLVLLLCLLLLSPWYNRTSWLGVKHELTYLLFFVCFLIIFVCFVLGCGFLLFSFLGGGGGGIGSFNYFFLVVIHRSSSLVRLWMCVCGGGAGGGTRFTPYTYICMKWDMVLRAFIIIRSYNTLIIIGM